MGRIKSSSLLAEFSGTVGNVTVSRWKGKGVIKKKGVRQSTTLSQKQLVQSAKFSVAINFVKRLRKLLEITYRSQAKGMSGQNAAMKVLLPKAITGSYPSFGLDYSRIHLSPDTSELPGAPAPAAVSNNPGIIAFTWTNNTGTTAFGSKAEASDKAMVVAWSDDLKKGIYNTAAGQRSDGSANLDVTPFIGLAVHTWMVFITEDQKETSLTQYLGLVTVQ
jgi:Family of unknown function (DUF6266)